MSRIIKFRFWLGGIGKMTYEHDLSEVASIIPDFTPDIVPLQFTGLHDKNGKEIYEGDIVRHEVENPKWEPLDDDSPLNILANSIVEYKNHGFWLSLEYFGWEGEGLADWSNLEVIGNIYENPELLQQKEDNS